MNPYLRLIYEAGLEAIWPTRCAICDTPGEVLCDACRKTLPFVNYYTSCPTCGAPFGRNVCCECTSVMLKEKRLDTFPLEGCQSALRATPLTIRLVTCYKDRGERRLAPLIAQMIQPIIPPNWPAHAALVGIPTSKASLQKRGFDQVELLVHELAHLTKRTTFPHLTTAKRARDQRKLSAHERQANMEGSFALTPKGRMFIPKAAILVDDVLTTGATLFAAANVLRKAGVDWIGAVTFLRV